MTFVKLTMWFDDVIIEGQDKCGGRLKFGFREKDFLFDGGKGRAQVVLSLNT